MTPPSDLVRLSIPIPVSLSERLSVLAWNCDLNRSQLARRYLAEAIAAAGRRFAQLHDQAEAEWWAEATRGYQLARELGVPSVVVVDEAPGRPISGDLPEWAER